jgi:capsular exopolysaccharide synthesis family protein
MVEKIKQALERAARERETMSGRVEPAAPRVDAPARPVKPAQPPQPVQPSLSTGQTATLADPLEAAKTLEINTRRLPSRRVVTYDDSHPAIESYRLLRTQLLQRHGTDKVFSIGITSPNPDEGKTLTSVNLAISLARSADLRVILLDADITNPSTHALFGMRVEQGLIDYLGGMVPLEKLLLRVNIPNLWFIPGRVVRESLVERSNMANFEQLILALTRDQRNIVIADLPPVLAKDDTLAIASRLDGIVMVVEEGSTRSAEIERSVDLLRQCNLLGTVFNKSSRKQHTYY